MHKKLYMVTLQSILTNIDIIKYLKKLLINKNDYYLINRS